MIKLIFIFSCIGFISAQTYYDAFTGQVASEEQLLVNDTTWCLNPVSLPCDASDFRRTDASCNNLKYPIKGMGKERFFRILPASFGPGWYTPRLAKSGSALPGGRFLRTSLLPEGSVPDNVFTHNLASFLVMSITDMASGHDTFNYVVTKTEGCTAREKLDPMYASNPVAADDPVFRFSGHNCTNMTRPISFQTQGCTNNYTTPERLNTATAPFDMSFMYGINEAAENTGRTFENGLLLTETDKYGRVWPPLTDEEGHTCIQNTGADETQCFVLPNIVLNTLGGLIVNGVWFYRQHNGIATELLKQNPTWSDEKLFKTAKDINIAIYMQIVMYEMLPLLAGRKNLIKKGVISKSNGFRDVYNSKNYPQVIIEYTAVMRWVHTIQEGIVKMYDNSGNQYDEIPMVNLTLRTGYFLKEGNMEGITQGFFRQAGASSDYVVDPDIANVGLGALQPILDLCVNDLMKHRYFGFQPYVKYLEYFSGKNYTKFEDLLDVIDPERVEALQNSYDDVEDIDLMAGVWLEKHVKGGYVPKTLFNILAKQFVMSIKADRYWYESSTRPNAYTYDQLQQIRNASLALTMCKYGDSVTEVQRQAFLKISEDNPLVSCDNITQIDFSVWKES